MQVADTIRLVPHVGDHVRDHLAAAAPGSKRPQRPFQVPVLALEGDQSFVARQRLAVALDQLGLVIERIDLAEGPGTEDDDHVPGPRPVVARPGRGRPGRVDGRSRLQSAVGIQQAGQGHRAQSPRGVTEEPATIEQGQGLRRGKGCGHSTGHSRNTNSLEFSSTRPTCSIPNSRASPTSRSRSS